MWPILTTDIDEKRYVQMFISQNKYKWEGRLLYIWGAGVRGTRLGYWLEKEGHPAFAFVDNDPDKWGNHLAGHKIYSHAILDDADKKFVIVSIENSHEIDDILTRKGYRAGYTCLKLGGAADEAFLTAMNAVKSGGKLILGSALKLCGLEEDTCLADSLTEKLNCTVLALSGFPLAIMYFALRQICLEGRAPAKTAVFLRYDVADNVNQLLPRLQKFPLAEKLLLKNQENAELKQYLQCAYRRAKNYDIEKQHCPPRGTDVQSSIEAGRLAYLKGTVMQELNPQNESFQYLRKLSALFRQYGTDVIWIWEPYDYQAMNCLLGPEGINMVEKKWDTIKNALGTGAACFNMGHLLTTDQFLSFNALGECVNAEGRAKVAEEMRKIWQ